MTIKRRLSQLEASSQTTASDFETHGGTLASILGKLDGVRWPLRAGQQSRDATLAIHQRQRLRQGVELNSGRSNSAGWQKDKRLRDGLAAAGLVEVTNALCSIPQAVERRLRAAITIWPGRVRTAVLEAILRSTNGWVVEDDFTIDRFDLCEMMLPLISEGAVEAKSNTAGNVFFRWLQDFHHADIEEPVRADWHSDYSDAFVDMLEERKRWSPQDAHEVYIPLAGG